ncbi:MAG: hypothetical protein WCL39_02305 [Armatimonadota bacterium]
MNLHLGPTAVKTIYILASLLVGGLLIAALTLTPKKARKPLIMAVTFIGGLYFSLEYMLPTKGTAARILASTGWDARVAQALFGWLLHPMATNPVLKPDENWLSRTIEPITNVWQVIAAFTFALGLWNLIHLHGRNVIHATRNWLPSIFFFIGALVMSLAGFFSAFGPRKETPLTMGLYSVATNGVFFQLDAAMFSLIAFFIISAAYRAFRIRSLEASIMMVAALLVMLGQIPVGQLITSWIPPDSPLGFLRLETISQWILRQPNAAAQRGINFGLAVGALATGLRIWLSLERGSYFEKEA